MYQLYRMEKCDLAKGLLDAEDFMPTGTGHPTQGITMTSIISLIGLTWNSCVSRWIDIS